MLKTLPSPSVQELPIAFRRALEELDDRLVNGTEKGFPDKTLRFGNIGKQGWNLLTGDVPLPSMVIRQADLEHNIALLQHYCEQNGAWLAPHGKTTMTPQIWAKQLKAGAWGITVANISQLQVCCGFGLNRVFVANEMLYDYDIQYIASQIQKNPEVEIYVLVDSQVGVERLFRSLAAANAGRPVFVLPEFGMVGGRAGARNLDELRALAEAVLRAEPVLRLAGVEGYEGVVGGANHEERVARAKTYLTQLAEAVRVIRALVPERVPFLVSAGGSMFFDLAVEILGREAMPDIQLVLRSGGYVTHDSSFYEWTSPLAAHAKRFVGGTALQPALEVWSVVLSRPEPQVAILGMGGRDMPVDIEMPSPLYHARAGSFLRPVGEGFRVLRANDQHAYLQVPANADVLVGDLVGCGISHPCTAFDKWRNLFLVDEERNIVGAVRTFF